jgi:hypothetical protein
MKTPILWSQYILRASTMPLLILSKWENNSIGHQTMAQSPLLHLPANKPYALVQDTRGLEFVDILVFAQNLRPTLLNAFTH